jgi:hypothetical protein
MLSGGELIDTENISLITTENIDITATTEDEQITTDRVSNPNTTITDSSMHYSKGISWAMIDEKENQSPLQCVRHRSR